jgi:phosphoglycerate dehydrogenase-like enzyme/glyoxylase-like metal-dependent hydrolase (beta-lactamase superfamily II)
MLATPRLLLLTLALVPSAGVPVAADDPLPRMQFNEVKEIAPGVFFRYSSISATDPKVPFGGSNNIWVVFEDYVVVFDANFPKEAGDVVADVKKTTDKPIRYVIDSHHHGDHAYGNAVFAQAGATVVAQAHCDRWLRTKGPKEFADQGRPPGGRKDVRESTLKMPGIVFDDKLVFEDGKQRAELYFFGHAHTPGDCCLYLPRHKILCTGDACLNGAFNYTGHSDTASWIRVLEQMQQLDVRLVCPGHGPVTTKDVIEKQKRYFVELRQQVRKGIDAGLDLPDIVKAIDMPWYKDWTGVAANSRGENLAHVYGELTGRVQQWDLVEDFGVYEGPSPTKDSPGWTKPRRIVVPNLMPARLAELKRVAPEIEFVPVKTSADAVRAVEDADAVLGFCTPDVVRAGKKLRWIQVTRAGVENDLSPELVASNIVLTNTQRIYGPHVADQAFALLLHLTRGSVTLGKLGARPQEEPSGKQRLTPDSALWRFLKEGVKPQELHGKRMLVVGLGGIGTQIARRANAFGMRVMALDPKDLDRPGFVFSLDKPAKLMDLLPKADVVVLACPLTAETRGLIGEAQLKAMKPSAYLINIGRGGLVQTPALVAALQQNRIAGAGMDVTDPEPLPDGHPLWKLPNVVISPHIGGGSPEGQDRQWRLFRDNVRRFVAGERLLCVVDKAKGY